MPESVNGMDVCEPPLARNMIIMAVAVATDVIIRYMNNNVK